MKTIDKVRSLRFTPGHSFVKPGGMIKRTLIFAGLLTAVSAFGGTTYDKTPEDSTGTDFTPVYSSKGKLAYARVTFCEDGDTVIENFYLGKSDETPNHTYLYLEETVLPPTGPSSGAIWVRGKEPLDGCNGFTEVPKDGGCDGFVAFFSRSIKTGSGIEGESKTDPACKAVGYKFKKHGKKNGKPLMVYDYTE
jgi:hypothetical protein